MTHVSRILMVDDQPEILTCLRRTLSRCGYHLACVENPHDAIELLGSETFDLLLSDVDMPLIDGHAVMAHARVLQPKMIRVFLTGSGSLATAVKAINEGEVHRFVPKPFDADQLRLIVREALERKTEIEIVSEASSRLMERKQLYAQLEAEHPGVTQISRDTSGVYAVSGDSLQQIAEKVGLMPGG